MVLSNLPGIGERLMKRLDDHFGGRHELIKTLSLLDDYNIYIQPINYPTVAVGAERLRIAPTPLHTDAMMYDLVEALRKVFKRCKGIQRKEKEEL